ncbi:MAG TPA: hypothetical protein VE987_05345, partial [Polyangiaceae bacterium]|nr:hypothetical protein [Polyangiaceae bacterium]
DADVDDLLQEVLAAACADDRVPVDPDDARRYLNACCRHRAVDKARARKRRERREAPADPDELARASSSAEDRVLARRLLEVGRTMFPRTHHWLERSAIGGESQASLAAEARVSPGHVRHEVSGIRRRLRAFALAAGALAVLALLLHMHFHARLRGAGRRSPETAPERAAEQLRLRAQAECAERRWRACAADLDEAARLDPDGDTLYLHELRDDADRQWRTLDDASP